MEPIKNPQLTRGRWVREPSRGSEAEGQELGAAGGVAIHQGAEADLVGDAKAGEAFHHDAGDDANHGGAAVKQFHLLELLHEGQLFRAVIKRWVVRRSVGHGFWWRNR